MREAVLINLFQVFIRRISFGRRRSGFSLIEVMIAVVIVSIVVIGVVGTLLLSRKSAERNKQRLSAIAVARQYIEKHARQKMFPSLVTMENIRLDDFNSLSDDDDLEATLTVRVFKINNDGSRGDEILEELPQGFTDCVELVVRVSWNRSGSDSNKETFEEIITYVSPNLM